GGIRGVLGKRNCRRSARSDRGGGSHRGRDQYDFPFWILAFAARLGAGVSRIREVRFGDGNVRPVLHRDLVRGDGGKQPISWRSAAWFDGSGGSGVDSSGAGRTVAGDSAERPGIASAGGG